MKKMTIIGGGYSEYSAPSVTALEVVVEKGFAASGVKTGHGSVVDNEWGGSLTPDED